MKGMKNAFLNNNDMSQYDKDIIDQALGFLKEDNKRFVKIVTAKKNVIAAESDIKIISDNKFYPVQYWLDTVTDPKHIEVLKELSYNSDQYLMWWDLKFGLYISKNPELSEIFNRNDYRLGGKSIKDFGKELVEKTDSEPFYDPEQHNAVDQWMDVLLRKIYQIIKPSAPSPSGETPEGTTTSTETADPTSTTTPSVDPLAQLMANITTMEPVKSDSAVFVKGNAKLVEICTAKMQALNPQDKLIFFGSQTFDFNKWWVSLPSRYSGTNVFKALERSLDLYVKNPEYDVTKSAIENNGVNFYISAKDLPAPKPSVDSTPESTKTSDTPEAEPLPAPSPPTTTASFRKNKFIKIAADPEPSFEDILDDYLLNLFGEPTVTTPTPETPKAPTSEGETEGDESEKSPKPKFKDRVKSFFEKFRPKPFGKYDLPIFTSSLDDSRITLFELGFEAVIRENDFFDEEENDVIVLQESLVKLLNNLFSAILAIENAKKKKQVENANNIAEQLKNTMDLTSAFYKGLGGSNLPTYTPRSRGKF